MELFFCDTCRMRVGEREIESGAALRVEHEIYCPQCLKTHPEAKAAAKAAGRASGTMHVESGAAHGARRSSGSVPATRRLSSSQRLSTSKRRESGSTLARHPSAIPAQAGGMLLVVASAVGLLIGAGIYLLVQGGGSRVRTRPYASVAPLAGNPARPLGTVGRASTGTPAPGPESGALADGHPASASATPIPAGPGAGVPDIPPLTREPRAVPAVPEPPAPPAIAAAPQANAPPPPGAAPSAGGPVEVKLLCGFEDMASIRIFDQLDDEPGRVTIVADHVTQGRGCLKLVNLPGASKCLTGAHWKGMPTDWSGYTHLAVDIHNDSGRPARLHANFRDTVSQAEWNPRKDVNLTLTIGANRVRIPIAQMRSNDRSRTIDFSAMYMFLMCLSPPGTYYVDNLRLERPAVVVDATPAAADVAADSYWTPLPGHTALIRKGDTWRYFKGTRTPGVAWTRAAYPDSRWHSGPTGIGYGDDDDATRLDDMRGRYVTVYLRRRFEVADPTTVSKLQLTVDYDDGFVAYLNGVEVARRNVPSGQDRNTTAGPSHEATLGLKEPDHIDLTPFVARLTKRSNVLALEVHNRSLGSSDLTIIPMLTMTTGAASAPTPPARPDLVVWEENFETWPPKNLEVGKPYTGPDLPQGSKQAAEAVRKQNGRYLDVDIARYKDPYFTVTPGMVFEMRFFASGARSVQLLLLVQGKRGPRKKRVSGYPLDTWHTVRIPLSKFSYRGQAPIPGDRINMIYVSKGSPSQNMMFRVDRLRAVQPGKAPLAQVSAAPFPGSATPLFNGRDLTGWRVMTPGWTVENNALVGRAKGANGMLMSINALPPDFELTFTAQVKGEMLVGWSGDKGTTYLSCRAKGALRLVHGRTELAKATIQAFSDVAHAYRIVARGPSVRVYVDGVQALASEQGTSTTKRTKRDIHLFAVGSVQSEVRIGGIGFRKYSAGATPVVGLAVGPPATGPDPSAVKVILHESFDTNRDTRWTRGTYVSEPGFGGKPGFFRSGFLGNRHAVRHSTFRNDMHPKVPATPRHYLAWAYRVTGGKEFHLQVDFEHPVGGKWGLDEKRLPVTSDGKWHVLVVNVAQLKSGRSRGAPPLASGGIVTGLNWWMRTSAQPQDMAYDFDEFYYVEAPSEAHVRALFGRAPPAPPPVPVRLPASPPPARPTAEAAEDETPEKPVPRKPPLPPKTLLHLDLDDMDLIQEVAAPLGHPTGLAGEAARQGNKGLRILKRSADSSSKDSRVVIRLKDPVDLSTADYVTLEFGGKNTEGLSVEVRLVDAGGMSIVSSLWDSKLGRDKFIAGADWNRQVLTVNPDKRGQLKRVRSIEIWFNRYKHHTPPRRTPFAVYIDEIRVERGPVAQ